MYKLNPNTLREKYRDYRNAKKAYETAVYSATGMTLDELAKTHLKAKLRKTQEKARNLTFLLEQEEQPLKYQSSNLQADGGSDYTAARNVSLCGYFLDT